MRSFKSAATKRINQLNRTPRKPVCHRNFHDRIIQNEEELNAFRLYIEHNPQAWSDDEENPKNNSK